MNPTKLTSLHPKMNVPQFAKEGHPSPWSASDINLLARIAQAFVNLEVRVGQSTQFILSDVNAIIQIAAAISSGGGSTGNANVAYGTIDSMADDTLVITQPGFEAFGTAAIHALTVYKPEELRTSRASEQLFNGTNTITVSYSYTSTGTQRTASVTASVPNNPGYDDETAVVIPQFIVNGTVNGLKYSSPILAISNGNTYIDVNAAGRAWTGVSTDPAP